MEKVEENHKEKVLLICALFMLKISNFLIFKLVYLHKSESQKVFI